MSRANYVVFDPIKILYIHYNPNKRAYIVSENKIGCCVFTKAMADSFINTYNIRSQFMAKEIEVRVSIESSPYTEADIYNALPH
jgi:hypothetical protein